MFCPKLLLLAADRVQFSPRGNPIFRISETDGGIFAVLAFPRYFSATKGNKNGMRKEDRGGREKHNRKRKEEEAARKWAKYFQLLFPTLSSPFLWSADNTCDLPRGEKNCLDPIIICSALSQNREEKKENQLFQKARAKVSPRAHFIARRNRETGLGRELRLFLLFPSSYLSCRACSRSCWARLRRTLVRWWRRWWRRRGGGGRCWRAGRWPCRSSSSPLANLKGWFGDDGWKKRW